jgi:hypothetical protein
MKHYILLFIATLIFSSGIAQSDQNGKAEAKLEAARIGLITERLNLTPKQAQQFWPVYNQFAQERRRIQQEYRNTRQQYNMQNMTEEEGKRLMKAGMDTKQAVLNLERDYAGRLNEVVSAKQLMALRKAEDDFRSMIIRRLEQRKRQQMMQQQQLRQREKKVQQGNN